MRIEAALGTNASISESSAALVIPFSPTLNRIALKSVVEPRVPQVVWYVDGEPFAITDPDQPVFWTVKPGAHTFQLRLPLQRGASRVIQVVVE